MSIRFKCGLCGHKMKADEKYSGRKIQCQNCDGVLTIPKMSGKVAEPKEEVEDDVDLFDEDDAPTTKVSTTRTTRLKRPSAQATSGERATKVKAKKSSSGKKEKEQSTPSWLIVGVICGSLACFLVVGVGIFMMGGNLASSLNAMGQVKAPETFEHFHHEHWVGVDYPTGFEVTSGGGTGGSPAWIKVKGDGGIEVQIREDHAAEAIGDIAQASPGGMVGVDGGMPEGPSDLDPVASVHTFLKMKVEPEFSGYEEQRMVPAKAKLGDARYSDFTASTMMGGKIYGLRGTVLSGPQAVKLIFTCNKRQWDAYHPVFVKMVESVSRD